MQTKKFLIAWGFLLIMLSSCIENSQQTETTTTENFPKENLTVAMAADKEVYYSGDNMNLSVRIESLIFLENAIVKVYGIRAGAYRIEDAKNIVLYPGAREIEFVFTTPRCYGCAGISPGIYDITVEIISDGKILKNETINVTIEQ